MQKTGALQSTVAFAVRGEVPSTPRIYLTSLCPRRREVRPRTSTPLIYTITSKRNQGSVLQGGTVRTDQCINSVCALRLRNTFPVWCTPFSGVHCRATRPQHTCAFLIAAYATLPYSLLVQATKYEHPNAHPFVLPLDRRLYIFLCTTRNTTWTHA